MIRILTLAYGVVSYLIFFLTFLYAIGFLGNVVVPKSLDSGPTDPWLTALTITSVRAMAARQSAVSHIASGPHC